jgi:hypothetical protein
MYLSPPSPASYPDFPVFVSLGVGGAGASYQMYVEQYGDRGRILIKLK